MTTPNPTNPDSTDNATGSTRHRLMMNNPDGMLKFMTAGKAIFTVKHRLTGDRATYRVEAQGEGLERTYKVLAFSGQDNGRKSHYTAMGTMDADGTWSPRIENDMFLDLEISMLKHTPPKSYIWKYMDKIRQSRTDGTPMEPAVEKRYKSLLRSHRIKGFITDPVKLRIFPELWEMLTEGKPVPPELEFWHEGCCGCCSKKLTVPASIELGHGPNCAKALNRYDEWVSLNEKLGTDLEAYAADLKARYSQDPVADI